MNIHTQLAIIPLIDQAYKNAFYEDMNAIFAMLFFAMYHLWQEKETPQWYFGRQLSIVGVGLWPVYFGAIKKNMSEFPKESGTILEMSRC